MFSVIRDKIETKLGTISSIQEVKDFPSENFSGFPAAMVTTTRNEAEFETTMENRRIYVFTVFLLQEIESQGESSARKIIEGVVDDVIKSFDEDERLTGLQADLDTASSNETVIVSYPLLSDIYTDPDTKYVIGEIEIRVVISFDVTG
ncbi:MAG: hypothetical protein ACTSO3_13525 [Candidatus Heimdallarchaeaceae archaeon]